MKNKILLSTTKTIITIIIIVAVSFLSGCSSNNSNQNNINDKDQLELVNYTIEIRHDLTGEEYKQITGFVKNNGEKKINKIKIEIKFYTKNDVELDINRTAYIYDLGSKKTKEFSTIYHSLTKDYYKVDWNDIRFEFTII